MSGYSYRAHPSTANYSGRSVDLLLLKSVFVPVSDKEVSPDVSGTPMLVSGIEKLAQRFALLYLTIAGSVHLSAEGSDIVAQIARGEIYDESTLKSAAFAANRIVARQIKDEDSELETPEDEALESSDVTDVSIDRATATVSVTISIKTKSGDTYVYVTPISTGI